MRVELRMIPRHSRENGLGLPRETQAHITKAPFGLLQLADFAAKRPRDELMPQANTDDRQLTLVGLADECKFLIDPREIGVGVVRATERQDPGMVIHIGRETLATLGGGSVCPADVQPEGVITEGRAESAGPLERVLQDEENCHAARIARGSDQPPLASSSRSGGNTTESNTNHRTMMRPILAAVLALLVSCPPVLAQEQAPSDPAQAQADVRDSVVKIFTTSRTPNLRRPWTRQTPQESTGTGFVIEGNRILTNAHVVDYARRVLVQPHQSSRKFNAEVVAIARGIDLAILELDDLSFFDEHPPAPMLDALPEIGAKVNAYGYPLGGDALSVTEGIVSRIEFADYKEATLGLRIQVDAALNPGNSGGPVLSDDQVIGVVFSGIPAAENTGYLIPIEEVRTFLADIEDGTYNGNPRVEYVAQTLENPQLREFLGAPREVSGLVVHDPLDHPQIQRFDIITHVGEHSIADDGMVFVNDLRLNWNYYVPRVMQTEENGSVSVPIRIWRDGESFETSLDATNEIDLVFSPLRGGYPDYAIFGPMCFTPVYREMADGLIRFAPGLAATEHPVVGRFTDKRAFEGEQLIAVVPPFFPHRLTVGYELSLFPILDKVNGVEIRNLAHMVETINAIKDEYTIFEWKNQGMELLVFRTDDLRTATEDVLEDNDIRSQFSAGIEDALDL